jgi:hypothetical protein
MVEFTGFGTATVDTKHPEGAETSEEELHACHKTDAKNDRQNEPEWRRSDDVAAKPTSVSALRS